MEDNRFDVWASKLRIKTAMCIHPFEDALRMLVAIGLPRQLGYRQYYDGVSYTQTFKPKVVTFKGKKFLQATLKQNCDLILGVSFPFTIAEAYISYGNIGFQPLIFRQRDGLY